MNQTMMKPSARLSLLIGVSTALGSIGVVSPVANAGTSSNNSAQIPKATLTTSWFAEPTLGGFYEAIAQKLYKKHGVHLNFKHGGPQVNGMQLLVAGQTDFYTGYGFQPFYALERGLPVVAVAAFLQKDPQCIMAHRNIDNLKQLKGHPIAVASYANTTYWPWLKYKYGYKDSQKQPYQFSVAPFLANKRLAQQAYITSEPYSVKEKAGFKPKCFLLADNGYPSYSRVLLTTRSMINNHPKTVQKVVDASIEGWEHYVKDPKAGNKLIKQSENSQMSDGLINYGVKKIRQYKLVTGGDAASHGVGTMTNAKWKRMYQFVHAAHMIKNINYKQAYTLQFVK